MEVHSFLYPNGRYELTGYGSVNHSKADYDLHYCVSATQLSTSLKTEFEVTLEYILLHKECQLW